VLRACHKRPISAQQISQLVDSIETEVFSYDDKEVPSRVIGELVMGKLKDLDPVAYVRFASVYREFKDVNTFMDELTKVLQEPHRDTKA
jgi:transcriptional repressor NrdR